MMPVGPIYSLVTEQSSLVHVNTGWIAQLSIGQMKVAELCVLTHGTRQRILIGWCNSFKCHAADAAGKIVSRHVLLS